MFVNGNLIIFVAAAAFGVIVYVKFRYGQTLYFVNYDERRKKIILFSFGREENGIKLEWYAYSQYEWRRWK